MKRLLGILIIVLGVISGLIAIGMNLFSEIRGYEGYCTYIDLPYYEYIILIEALFTIFLFSFFIYIYFFEKLKKAFSPYYDFILGFLLTNYAFIAFKIVEFPRVLPIPIWNTEPIDDQHLGLAYHPFIWIWIVYSMILLGLNYRLHRNQIL